MIPVNKCLNKVVKLNLWVLKPIRMPTLHIMLNKSSNMGRFNNPLSPSEIYEFIISNQFQKIVFEASVLEECRLQYR